MGMTWTAKMHISYIPTASLRERLGCVITYTGSFQVCQHKERFDGFGEIFVHSMSIKIDWQYRDQSDETVSCVTVCMNYY